MSSKSYHSIVQPDETFWRLEVAILPGKLEEFQALVREQIASSEKEEGTLAYEWYFNADNTECHTYERYRDSEAVIAHGTTFGDDFAERVLKTCTPTRLNVYGAPNDKAKAILDLYGAVYFSKWEGSYR